MVIQVCFWKEFVAINHTKTLRFKNQIAKGQVPDMLMKIHFGI
jgi:hypothetical protein